VRVRVMWIGSLTTWLAPRKGSARAVAARTWRALRPPCRSSTQHKLPHGRGREGAECYKKNIAHGVCASGQPPPHGHRTTTARTIFVSEALQRAEPLRLEIGQIAGGLVRALWRSWIIKLLKFNHIAPCQMAQRKNAELLARRSWVRA
jgi:hypothetical protein